MRKRIFIALFATTVIGILISALLSMTFFRGHASHYGNMIRSIPFLLLLSILLVAITSIVAWRVTSIIATAINKVNFDDPDDVYDELNEFFQKIIRQKRQIEDHENELWAQSETSKSIIENMQDGFVIVDPAGTVVTANPRALELFETDQNPEGKNVICLMTNSVFLDKVGEALCGNGNNMTLTKQERVVQVSFLPSANRGAIILATDSTEKDRAEKMRREFSANVSHELKTPLTTIAGFSELIMEGFANPEDIVQFAAKINNQAKHMTRLIENIIFLSRLDEQDVHETFISCNIAEIATEVIDGLSHIAETQQISVTLVGESCIVNCNKLLIYEMLMNLVENAIQYNIPNGKVDVTIKEDDSKCIITVTDTGIGIPKEEQARVFERFYRVEQSRCRKTGGAGLGLSIVNHIVRYHNGVIELSSEANQGLQVEVSLPL